MTNVADVFALALRHQQAGNLDEAEQLYQQALSLRPNSAEIHSNLGNVLEQLGRFEEAAAHCYRALAIRPDFPEAHNNLGNSFLGLDKIDLAVSCFRQALQINPNFAQAHINLGNTLARQDKLDEAEACYRQAIQLKPDFALAYTNLGTVQKRQGRLEQATASYRRATELQPDDEAATYNLGLALTELGSLDEAVACFQQALRLKLNLAEAHNGLGVALLKQGQFDGALASFERALCLNGRHADTHLNRAQLWLLLGNWKLGWPEFEWRWQTTAFTRPAFRQPRWDGSPLKGRTILVATEQGLGDTLQFIRYVPLLQQQGGRVIVQCQAPLEQILRDSLRKTTFIVAQALLPEFDVYVSLLSLPGILETSPASIPTDVPYLHANADLVQRWRQKLEPLEGFKIGIAWQGSRSYPYDRQRSIPLPCFAPLNQMVGVKLVSLQKGPGAEQLLALGSDYQVMDLGSRLDEASGPFMDTAAVIENVDLVITSDTAIAHLAGALGKPVWVALADVPDWRWLLQRQDSPWYPTMRLFRQTRQGQWQDVFERMVGQLQNRIAKPRR